MGQTVDIVEGPAVEPVSLDEAKAQLGVTEDYDDDLIVSDIIAAREYCENYTSRAFITQTIAVTLDGFPFTGGYWNAAVRANPNLDNYLPTRSGVLIMPRPPVQSVVSISYLDSTGNLQTVSPTIYRLIKGSLSATKLTVKPGQLWPITYPQPGSTTITLLCGYGDASAVPMAAKKAIKILVSHWYNHRDEAGDGSIVEHILTPLCWAG